MHRSENQKNCAIPTVLAINQPIYNISHVLFDPHLHNMNKCEIWYDK